jgi:predicted CXXCH cytochrome family protein
VRKLQYGLLCLIVGVGVFLAVMTPGRGQNAAQPELAGAIGILAAQAPAFYAGSQACAACHPAEHKAWMGSHHAQAMSVATPETVRGDFSGQNVEIAGASGRFFKQDGQFMVETEGSDGKLEIFRVSHTFGLEPLQQYLVSFPDGRLQALPWAWDARPKAEGGQKWFHVYGDQPIPPGDPLHWTGRQQTWNFMCAECHSTALNKNYDAATNTYRTIFSEISIGCESCHGPAAGHLTWAARSPRAQDPNQGFADTIPKRPPADWKPDPATGSPAGGVSRPAGDSVELCARCHARRATLSEDWKPGKNLAQTHASAYLTQNLFEADGQMRDEVFNDQVFKQSRMYARGVACIDCHDPHSGKLKAEGAEICSQCHDIAKFADAKHTGHKPSPGAPDCIACHMPARTYMVVDRRHDHSFRIPRPDLTLKAGTPNACNDCHKDKSAQWAEDALTKWQGPRRKGFQTYAEAFQLARAGDPQARALLIALAQNPVVPAIARGTALVELAAFPSAASAAATRESLRDPDPVVRIAALRNFAGQPPEARVQALTPLIDDPVLGVRLEVGRALAGVTLDQVAPEQGARLAKLFAECESVLRLEQDRPEGRANLATFLMGRNRLAEAEAELRAGLKLDPRASELAVNLADLYRATGRDALGLHVLNDSLAAAPDNGAAHHALGLALVRAKNYPEALDHLAKASMLAPDDARFAYVYGVALKSLGKPEQSRAVLQGALQRHPWDAALLNAALSDALAGGDAGAAAPLAQRLSSLRPDDQALARLAARLAGQ